MKLFFQFILDKEFLVKIPEIPNRISIRCEGGDIVFTDPSLNARVAHNALVYPNSEFLSQLLDEMALCTGQEFFEDFLHIGIKKQSSFLEYRFRVRGIVSIIISN